MEAAEPLAVVPSAVSSVRHFVPCHCSAARCTTHTPTHCTQPLPPNFTKVSLETVTEDIRVANGAGFDIYKLRCTSFEQSRV